MISMPCRIHPPIDDPEAAQKLSRGRPVSVERLGTSERLRLLARAGSRDQRYDLLRNNCEHTYYRSREGRHR